MLGRGVETPASIRSANVDASAAIARENTIPTAPNCAARPLALLVKGGSAHRQLHSPADVATTNCSSVCAPLCQHRCQGSAAPAQQRQRSFRATWHPDCTPGHMSAARYGVRSALPI